MTLITDTRVPLAAGEMCERLRAVRTELATLAQTAFASFTEPEAGSVVAEVEQVTRGVEALQTQCAGGIDAGQAWAASGYQSFAKWWSLHTHRRRSTSHAARMLARDLRERLPLTARALTQGQLGAEHARVLARFTKSEAQQLQLREESMGEGFLVAQAARMGVEDFTAAVREWATRSDPDAADRNWRDEYASRELFIAPVLDGTDVRGWLGTEEGAVLAEALNAIIGTPSAEDERTPAQRRADALVHLCRVFLDSGTLQPGARIRPHLAITIDYTTLERLINAGNPACLVRDAFGLPTSAVEASNGGTTPWSGPESAIPAGLDYALLTDVAPGTFADGTPIPHGHLSKLLCDGEFHRVVFGPDGEILDSGRTERLFTPAQTRAVIARDRHCQYPGCSAPPGQGEIHHSIWWYHQGRTSTENAILLCWHHHALVHQRHLSITRHTGPDVDRPGWWIFTDPDGRTVQTVPPPAASASATEPPQPPLRQ